MSLMAAAIQGLPPLPKSLSGLLSFNRESLSREASLRAAQHISAEAAAEPISSSRLREAEPISRPRHPANAPDVARMAALNSSSSASTTPEDPYLQQHLQQQQRLQQQLQQQHSSGGSTRSNSKSSTLDSRPVVEGASAGPASASCSPSLPRSEWGGLRIPQVREVTSFIELKNNYFYYLERLLGNGCLICWVDHTQKLTISNPFRPCTRLP